MVAEEAKPATLGTAGHVDHGKTALVGALTGKNTDRLAEERRRGLSIELGFAELRLPSGRRLSVVDVPGHERFVRTMVAGATGIDLFLMVVAADSGVMPQTREHLAILRSLGLDHGLVAITKCDLADREQRRRAAEGAQGLIPTAPLVEVSARSGHGLDALRDAIAQTASAAEVSGTRRSEWPHTDAVLHVDRVFTLKGIGTVITGTLWSGSLAVGDRARILPGGSRARIRSIQIHDRGCELAAAGQRVALNLAGLDRGAVRRGDVIAAADCSLAPTYRLDVELRLQAWEESPAGKRVQVHHGTRDVPARVVALDDENSLAQLRLEAPVLARSGDRFVLRAIAPRRTLGGGIVLDPRPARHGPGQATDQLRLICEADPEALVELELTEGGGISADPRQWTSAPLLGPALRRFPLSRWEDAVEHLADRHRAIVRRGQLLLRTREDQGQRRERRTSPEPAGLARQVLLLLKRDGAEPRAPQALADSLALDRRQALALLEGLVRRDRVVCVKPGVYYTSEALECVRAKALSLLEARGSITIAELRDALGTSRKYALAILEHLDASHATLRQGDRHVLRRARSRSAGPPRARLAAGRQGSGGPSGLQSQ